jgi:pSer/pThr/pTyr-binding forkhead associated (FHA) protein
VFRDARCGDYPDGDLRDSGSANGVFVNGQRIERAVPARRRISLGEVQITLLPEPAALGQPR